MIAANTAYTEAGRPLQAFWLGLEEIYAAYSAEGALQLANLEYRQTLFRMDVFSCARFRRSKPRRIQLLAHPWALWQHVALMRTPGYVGMS